MDTDWVWTMPTTGEHWCNCGVNPLTGQPKHQVTRPLITKHVAEALGDLPEKLLPQQLMAVTKHLWKFPEVTPEIAEALMRSVQAVTKDTPPFYDLDTAMAIIKHFSATWGTKV